MSEGWASRQTQYQAIADECGIEAEVYQSLYQASVRKEADLEMMPDGKNELFRTRDTTERLRSSYRSLVEAASVFTKLANGEGR